MSDAGIRISRDTALKFSPVFRAVDLLSSAIAKTPCVMYRRTPEGKERMIDDPRFALLKYKPNAEQTAFYLLKTAVFHCLLEPGNAYIYIDRTGLGVEQLILLDPFCVYPVRANGQLFYTYQPASATPMKIPADQVIHLKGLGFDGLSGYSVMSYATNSIGMGLAAQKYSNAFFKNSAEPRVVLEYPAWLKDEQIDALRKGWDSFHQGVDNMHKTGVIQGGTTAKVLSGSARDAQLIEALNWSIKDVSNWFGVPAHKLGDASRTAYNSLEQENQSLLDDTVDPWMVMIEQELRDKLLTPSEQLADTVVIEFNRAALVRANLAARGTYYREGLAGHPWLIVDEVRNFEGLNGVGLDDIVAPANNFGTPEPEPEPTPPADVPPPAQQASAPTPEAVRVPADCEPPEPRGLTWARMAVDDCKARMLKRVQFNIEAGQRKGKRRDVIFQEHLPVMRELLRPSCNVVAAIDDKAVDDLIDIVISEIKSEVNL
jgi:HK97 family phage portal protein